MIGLRVAVNGVLGHLGLIHPPRCACCSCLGTLRTCPVHSVPIAVPNRAMRHTSPMAVVVSVPSSASDSLCSRLAQGGFLDALAQRG